jgi:hypothetical protein
MGDMKPSDVVLARIKDHEALAMIEAEGINLLFSKSKVVALVYTNDAIKSFHKRLEGIKGAFVPGMDIEYRSFILKLLSCIDEEYLPDVTKEVIVPQYSVPLADFIKIIDS